MHKHVHGRSFKKRAPHAVKAVVQFAQKAMGTRDVRLDPKLNQALWAQGVKSVPHRVRVKLERAYARGERVRRRADGDRAQGNATMTRARRRSCSRTRRTSLWLGASSRCVHLSAARL
jgi:ribosomal protein L31E